MTSHSHSRVMLAMVWTHTNGCSRRRGWRILMPLCRTIARSPSRKWSRPRWKRNWRTLLLWWLCSGIDPVSWRNVGRMHLGKHACRQPFWRNWWNSQAGNVLANNVVFSSPCLEKTIHWRLQMTMQFLGLSRLFNTISYLCDCKQTARCCYRVYVKGK